MNTDATKKPVFIDAEKSASAVKIINDMTSSILFMKDLLDMGKCSNEDVKTHMQLLHYGYDNLAVTLGQDVLNAKLEDYGAMLREANGRIHDLESQLGGETTTDAAVGRIAELETRFATWYQLCGFHYASVSWNQRGFSMEFSHDVDHLEKIERTSITFGSRNLAVKIQDLVPYIFTDDKYDLRKDSFHDDLLDTDKNRKALQVLFSSTFPGARVTDVKGLRDHDDFLLRVTVYVPYSGIDAWYDGIMETLKEHPCRNSGDLYVRQAEISHSLSNKNFLRYAPPKDIEKMRAEQPFVETVTGLWDEFGDVPMNPETECIESEWVAKWMSDGAEQETSFPAGTFREDIWHWFEETFQVSVAKDLMGV